MNSRFSFLALAILITFGCINGSAQQASRQGTSLTVTDQDNGKDVDLASDRMLIVKLPSNPSTGYSWSLAGEPWPLKLKKSSFSKKAGSSNSVGGSGTAVFQLTARSSGMANLTFVYRRSWEYNIPPIKTFSIRVNVH